MKNKKLLHIRMLPTKGKSRLQLHAAGDLSWSDVAENCKYNQHLYMTSDDEIKEGDWYIDDTNAIRQSVMSDKDYWDRRPNYKKVVTTTDLSLKLPPIPHLFVDHYTIRHNKLKPIQKVWIELNDVRRDQEDSPGSDHYQNDDLIVNGELIDYWSDELAETYIDKPRLTESGFVILLPEKQSWNRAEVETLLKACWTKSAQAHSGMGYATSADYERVDREEKEWIEEQL